MNALTMLKVVAYQMNWVITYITWLEKKNLFISFIYLVNKVKNQTQTKILIQLLKKIPNSTL